MRRIADLKFTHRKTALFPSFELVILALVHLAMRLLRRHGERPPSREVELKLIDRARLQSCRESHKLRVFLNKPERLFRHNAAPAADITENKLIGIIL